MKDAVEKKEWGDVLCMTRSRGIDNNANYGGRKSREKKSGKKQGKGSPEEAYKAHESLDVIPLFQRLSSQENSPFDTFAVIYDGISRGRRPTEAATNAQASSTSKVWQVDESIFIEITDIY